MLRHGITPEVNALGSCIRFVAEFIGRVNLFSGKVGSADGPRLTLDVPELGGLVASRAHDDVPTSPGAAVTVAVRPEMISLRSVTDGHEGTPSQLANSYAGRLVRSAYGATATLYEVALESEGRSKSWCPARSETARQASKPEPTCAWRGRPRHPCPSPTINSPGTHRPSTPDRP